MSGSPVLRDIRSIFLVGYIKKNGPGNDWSLDINSVCRAKEKSVELGMKREGHSIYLTHGGMSTLHR